jgi:eukaryotic-like serine/threonine-protein kinase
MLDLTATELRRMAELRVGTVLLGKYRLEGVIGVGGMAAVYAATHRNRKQVAIKMLHPQISSLQDVCSRFLREGYAANSVGHPGTVSVLDDDVAEDGSAFLVMELLSGASLEDVWRSHDYRLPVDAVFNVGDQLLDVLAAAHAKAVVHRDVKPANLFLTRSGELKVLDFGIARVRDTASPGASATSTGTLLGTPSFMSPEQARGLQAEIDAPADLWSAGATLFTMLTGRTVHEGDNALEVRVKAATERASLLASVAPHVPAALASIVDRALAFEKKERWPSAGSMRDAIRSAYRMGGSPPPGRELLAALLLPPPAAAHATVEAPGVPSETLPAPEGLSAWGVAGANTTKPVSRSERGAPAPPRGAWSRIALGAGAACVVIALGAGVYSWSDRLFDPKRSPKDGMEVPRQPAISSEDSPSVPPQAVTEAGVAHSSDASAADKSPAPGEAGSPDDTSGASVDRLLRRRDTGTTRRPPAQPSASAGKVDCDPPYRLDSQGQKQFKSECYR